MTVRRSSSLAVALLALVSLWVGCAPGKDRDAQPDILLVLMPGLRADPPGPPGAEAALLAPFGTQPRRSFTQAYSQSISPHLSLGSALTGIYPSAIPLCGFADLQHPTLASQPWCSALPTARASLPQALAAYGWRTVHFHGGYLEQLALQGHFEQEVVLPSSSDSFATPWTDLETQLLSWWGPSDQPRLAVLQLADLMQASTLWPALGVRPPDPAILATYGELAAGLGQGLATLVSKLESASRRPRSTMAPR